MAERRYGFRFSFAEGCLIAVSVISASFLVFLFGVYAGRELEARKTAEHTNIVRLSPAPGVRVRDPSPENVRAVETKAEKAKPGSSPTVVQDAPKTVVVVNPAIPSEPASAPRGSPPAPPLDNRPLAKPEPPAQAPVVSKTPPVQEKQPSPTRATPPSPPLKQPQTTGGSWSIQIHATRDKEAARELAERLRVQGHAPVVSKIVRDGEMWYRVRVGSFASADEARASLERFRREGQFSQAYPVSN
jgi:cell division septation protein DedD